jgi:hypothetical protein
MPKMPTSELTAPAAARPLRFGLADSQITLVVDFD